MQVKIPLKTFSLNEVIFLVKPLIIFFYKHVATRCMHFLLLQDGNSNKNEVKEEFKVLKIPTEAISNNVKCLPRKELQKHRMTF